MSYGSGAMQLMFIIDIRKPESGFIPGHVGVIPAQPGYLRTTGAKAWTGIKVVARMQLCDFMRVYIN